MYFFRVENPKIFRVIILWIRKIVIHWNPYIFQTVQAQIDPGWMRVKAAMKSCPKCVPIDTRDIFMENDEWVYYDKKTHLSYLCDNNHLSPPGVEKMVPKIKEVITEAIKNL